jgi:hypothetical protein
MDRRAFVAGMLALLVAPPGGRTEKGLCAAYAPSGYAEMKPTWLAVWALAVGVVNHRTAAQGERAQSPAPSVDEEPQDDD